MYIYFPDFTLDLPADTLISGLEFNEDGSCLLLYSSKFLGVIYIPKFFFSQNIPANNLQVIELAPEYTRIANIVKVSWHPYRYSKRPKIHLYYLMIFNNFLLLFLLLHTFSTYDIFVLFDGLHGPLLGVNATSLKIQEYPLQGKMLIDPIVSFTFGPKFGWLRFTVLLLSNKGKLYTLCEFENHTKYYYESLYIFNMKL